MQLRDVDDETAGVGRCSGGGERTEGAKDSVTGLNKNEIVMMTKR